MTGSRKSCACASRLRRPKAGLGATPAKDAVDLEMRSDGALQGHREYSRHRRARSLRPRPRAATSQDYILFVDESHQTCRRSLHFQATSRRRRWSRLRVSPAVAQDKRLLGFENGGPLAAYGVRVATPRVIARRHRVVVEQIIRPTGLLDPEIEVRPVTTQVDDLLGEIRERVKAGERVLCTTLTKRMAEDLTEYYAELGVRVRYLHSDIETLERIEILRDLRLGEYDVLVGINLLREGLDLPEVSLGRSSTKGKLFRAERSLIRPAAAPRHVRGKFLCTPRGARPLIARRSRSPRAARGQYL